jgi:NAD(P)H-flavin reductase
MENPYQTHNAKIIKIIEQAPNIKLFRFDITKKLDFFPGQIIFLSIPGFGEAPFAPCNPLENDFLELCVRKVGRLTQMLHTLKIGDSVGIRGPYGQGWPSLAGPDPAKRGGQINKNILIVIGGLGLVPLRTLLWSKNKFLSSETKIQIFYGAKTPDDFLFENDYAKWKKEGIDLKLTIDKECPGWNECVGVVTALFDKHLVSANTTAFLCGPPIMYKFVLEKLKEKNVPDENIYLSLERRMHCGIGVCQHCAVGSFYTCKDGPVFRYDQIKNIPGAI